MNQNQNAVGEDGQHPESEVDDIWDFFINYFYAEPQDQKFK